MIHLPVAASLCIVAVAGAGRDEECDAFAAAAGTEPVPIRRLWPFSQFQWVSPRQWGPIQQTNQPGPCSIQPPGGCTNAQSTCKVGTLLTNQSITFAVHSTHLGVQQTRHRQSQDPSRGQVMCTERKHDTDWIGSHLGCTDTYAYMPT